MGIEGHRVRKEKKVRKEIVHLLRLLLQVDSLILKVDRSLFINLILNKKEQWSRWKLFVYLVFNIESAQKGDIKVYQTNCHDVCRDVSIKIEYDSEGDAYLYTNEDSPPTERAMKTANCPDCLCTSKKSNSSNVCIVTLKHQKCNSNFIFR